MLRPDEIIGPYKLIRKIGGGSFGEVWLAENYRAIAPPRALKFPLGAEIDIEAVKREAQIWVRANGHPNVLSIIEAQAYDGHLVIVSEYAPDGSLWDWLNAHGGQAPSLTAACEMMAGILAGLEHLHEQKIIHRDLKPGNILLQGQTPRLADFGISRVLQTTHAEQSAIAGTPVYMAPEAFKGQRSIQTDTWAAGVLFYQLLTGRLPFTGDDWPSVMHAVINDPYLPLPASVPAPLPTVIDRALQKDPAQRFQSAAEMRQALLKAAQPAPTQPQPPPPEPLPVPPPPQPIGSRRKYYVAAGVVLALAIGLVMFLNRNSSAPAQASSEATPLSLAPTPTSTVADSPTPSALQTAALQSFTEDLGNGVKLEMVAIPGGTFLMGSLERYMTGFMDNYAQPQHQVTVAPFYIGKYEVTQVQWKAVMSKLTDALMSYDNKFRGDNLPMVGVSWIDAGEFTERLKAKTGRIYRLPSEAEWEYAARAGTTSAWSFGEDASLLDRYAWCNHQDDKAPHPVGQKKPNAWGLFDVHGNVTEWCADAWHDNYDGAPNQSTAWVTGVDPYYNDRRPIRGGAWFQASFVCRSANRVKDKLDKSDNFTGFRIACEIKRQ